MTRPRTCALPSRAIASYAAPMLRSALFAFVGLAFSTYWVVADPSFEDSASQSEWSYVLAFSGLILLLAFAVPTLAQLVGGRLAFRVSLVAAAARLCRASPTSSRTARR